MAATPLQFVKAGQTYFNVNQVTQVVTQGDGTARFYYTATDFLTLNLGMDEAAAIAALDTLLTPTDITSYL